MRLAQAAGVPSDQLVLCTAIAMAESGGRTDNIGVNKRNGSRDRGLWQINDKAHPEVSDDCAFNPPCAAQAMYSISKGGRKWKPWAAYNNNSYKKFLPDAVKVYLKVLKEQTQTNQNPMILQTISNLELLLNRMMRGEFYGDYGEIRKAVTGVEILFPDDEVA
jgi:Lysozyme like domain